MTQNLCQCQTDQNYNLILLISGAFHTKSLSNGPKEVKTLCNFRWPASHEICVSVKLTKIEINFDFLISGALHTKSVSNFRWPASHEICVSVKLTKIRISILWFQVHFTRNLCQMAPGHHDFCDFRWPASHEFCVTVKLTKITIWLFWFQVHFTRNLCQMARGDHDLSIFRWAASHEICVSVKLTIITIWIFLISGVLHTKSVSKGPKRSWFI